MTGYLCVKRKIRYMLLLLRLRLLLLLLWLLGVRVLLLLRRSSEAQKLERRRSPASDQRLLEKLELALQLARRVRAPVRRLAIVGLRDRLVYFLQLSVRVRRDVQVQCLVNKLDLERSLYQRTTIPSVSHSRRGAGASFPPT
jgi:hypothetical protein